MPNQNPTQNAPLDQSVQEQPFQPDFQKISDEKTDGSTTSFGTGISSVISPPRKKFGTGKIIATILSLFLLVGGVGAGIALTQQQQLFQQKAASCGATCRTNCTEDETGQGQGSCPSGQVSCVANSCNGVPDAGTSCVSAGFVCVPKGSCSAGHNQTGSCNTANTDCCDTVSTSPPPNAISTSCVFDNYERRGCVFVNGTWSMCDKDPKGETGVAASCSNSGSSGVETGCSNEYPNCNRAGTYCINSSKPCVPTVAQYANCVSDSSCSTTTPTTVAPYCVAVKPYSASWSLLTTGQLSALTPGSTVNFCVSGNAPSGTFDKAQFTIKGVQLAETTTQRSGSNDFCQSYTILATDRTISIIAKIHHSTLGWYQ